MLRGVQRDLDILVVYRDGMHLLGNGKLACKIAMQGLIRQMKLWVHHARNQNSVIPRTLIKALNFLPLAK